MASQIAAGAANNGAMTILKRVENCTLDDLARADGLAVGSPTYYCNMAWQIKKFLDEKMLEFYAKGNSLRNKVCGCFTSAGVSADGQECLRAFDLAFRMALKMRVLPGLVLESMRVDGDDVACFKFG